MNTENPSSARRDHCRRRPRVPVPVPARGRQRLPRDLCRLPPLLAFGETLDEARAIAREEIEAWVETAEVRADYSVRFR